MSKEKILSKEVQAYLKKAFSKIQSAEVLLQQEFYEDAVSRAYYAIFHAIAAILRFKNVELNVHKHVVILNQFRENFIDNKTFSLEMYAKIQNIKMVRESADYSVRVKINEETAKESIEDAKKILKEIQDYLESKKNELI